LSRLALLRISEKEELSSDVYREQNSSSESDSSYGFGAVGRPAPVGARN
jgi:hypothetical protein